MRCSGSWSCRVRRFLTGVIVVLVGGSLGHSADICVNTTLDLNNGNCLIQCSLRDAILVSNYNEEDDTIHVPAGTYTLTQTDSGGRQEQAGDLDLVSSDSVTIVGEGPGVTIIDGGGIDRVFDVNAGAGPVTLKGLTVTGGLSLGYGGGVNNWDSTLVIVGCEISGNETISSLAEGIFYETAAFNWGGGGIYNEMGALWLIDTWVHDNVSWDCGGGIVSNSGSLFQMDRSTVSGNVAATGGAVRAMGEANFNNVTFYSNSSTIEAEEVSVAGGSATFTHCTLDVGADPANGTAIYCHGSGALVTLQNTIVSGVCDVDAANIDAQSGNVEWGDTCFMGSGNYPNAGINIGLGSFGYNGGGVPTVSLSDGGVAADYVFTADYLLNEDARFVQRPVGAYGDAGAFERVPDEIFLHNFENGYPTGWSEVVR